MPVIPMMARSQNRRIIYQDCLGKKQEGVSEITRAKKKKKIQTPVPPINKIQIKSQLLFVSKKVQLGYICLIWSSFSLFSATVSHSVTTHLC
jgi:hypothetical protein